MSPSPFAARVQPNLAAQYVERPALHFVVPLWSEPKIARDQHARVAEALYSLPTKYVGRRLRARADRTTVRFHDGPLVVAGRVHIEVPAVTARDVDQALRG